MDRVERVARAAFAESVRYLGSVRTADAMMEEARDYFDGADAEQVWREMDETLREYWRRVAIVAIREAGN